MRERSSFLFFYFDMGCCGWEEGARIFISRFDFRLLVDFKLMVDSKSNKIIIIYNDIVRRMTRKFIIFLRRDNHVTFANLLNFNLCNKVFTCYLSLP